MGATREGPVRHEGALRRIVVLPSCLDPNPPRSRNEFPRDTTLWMDAAAQAYLTDWKGYEIVDKSEIAGQVALVELACSLGRWQLRQPKNDEPPEELRRQLQKIAANGDVDGAVVVCWAPWRASAFDVLAMFMIVGMPHFYQHALAANLSAGMYDTAHGGLVKRHAINVDADVTDLSQQSMTRHVEALLADFENAQPALLERRTN